MEELFTKAEVCEALQISESTLNRIIQRRDIQYCMVSGRARFRGEDVSAYLQKQTVKARPNVVETKNLPEPQKRRPGRPPINREIKYIPGMKVV